MELMALPIFPFIVNHGPKDPPDPNPIFSGCNLIFFFFLYFISILAKIAPNSLFRGRGSSNRLLGDLAGDSSYNHFFLYK